MTDEELAASRQADYARYKALMDLFIDTIIEGPPQDVEPPLPTDNDE